MIICSHSHWLHQTFRRKSRANFTSFTSISHENIKINNNDQYAGTDTSLLIHRMYLLTRDRSRDEENLKIIQTRALTLDVFVYLTMCEPVKKYVSDSTHAHTAVHIYSLTHTLIFKHTSYIRYRSHVHMRPLAHTHTCTHSHVPTHARTQHRCPHTHI